MADQRLWEAMQDAVIGCPPPMYNPAGAIAAAQILAVADWLVPEEPELPVGEGEPWPQAYQQRMAIRKRLLAEAALAAQPPANQTTTTKKN